MAGWLGGAGWSNGSRLDGLSPRIFCFSSNDTDDFHKIGWRTFGVFAEGSCLCEKSVVDLPSWSLAAIIKIKTHNYQSGHSSSDMIYEAGVGFCLVLYFVCLHSAVKGLCY